MIKQNGSGIRTRFKNIFRRDKKKITNKKNGSIKDVNKYYRNMVEILNNQIQPENQVVEPIYATVNEEKKYKNTIKKEKKINKNFKKTQKINKGIVSNYSINLTGPQNNKSKKKLKKAAKALGKKGKGQQSNNEFTPKFKEMIKNKGITNNSINNSNTNKKKYAELVLSGSDKKDIEKYLNEEENNNTFIIWKKDSKDNDNMNNNEIDKPRYMISMKIKKSAITKFQSNDNIHIFNHNIIHKNEGTGKYSIVGLNSKDNNINMEFNSLYDIIKFTIEQRYQLLYIEYNDDNDEIVEKKYLKNNQDLLEFFGKWKINPLYNSTEGVLESEPGYEIFTESQGKPMYELAVNENNNPSNLYNSVMRGVQAKSSTPKIEKTKCEECQNFMSMDKNKWCLEDNQNNTNKKKRKPTPLEREMCDNCKTLMKEDTDCKKINKNNKSHYQNLVKARPTINPRQTHNGQTYATLKRIGSTHKTSTRNPTYNKLKSINFNKKNWF